MKKIKQIVFTVLFLSLFTSIAAFAADSWIIEVNGIPLNTEVKVIDGRSLIPLRTVGEALGLEVTYDNTTGVITLASDNENFSGARVYLNSKNGCYYAAITDGTADYSKYNLYIESNGNYKVNVMPVNINGSVYVPVRVVCDSFGAPVSAENRKISIGSCFTDWDASYNKVTKLVSSAQKSQNQVNTTIDTATKDKPKAEVTTTKNAPAYVKTAVINHLTNAVTYHVQAYDYAIYYGKKPTSKYDIYDRDSINAMSKAQENLKLAKHEINEAIYLCGNYEDTSTVKQYCKTIYNDYGNVKMTYPTGTWDCDEIFVDMCNIFTETKNMYDLMDIEFQKWLK